MLGISHVQINFYLIIHSDKSIYLFLKTKQQLIKFLEHKLLV